MARGGTAIEAVAVEVQNGTVPVSLLRLTGTVGFPSQRTAVECGRCRLRGHALHYPRSLVFVADRYDGALERFVQDFRTARIGVERHAFLFAIFQE